MPDGTRNVTIIILCLELWIFETKLKEESFRAVANWKLSSFFRGLKCFGAEAAEVIG